MSTSAPARFISDHTMTPTERRASSSLASIFALRMLGLFLVLPVFALEAARYPGGDDPARVGLAMGMYGLTQGLLQIPFGIASDWWGRKRVMIIGLVIFALGSFIAAWAPDLTWLIIGRAVQGAGAISAAVTALLADSTRDSVRTKAMALVGGSIALMFALSLLIAPLLASAVGLHGIFALTGSLGLAGIVVVLLWVPPEPARRAAPAQPVADSAWHNLRSVLASPALRRLDFGVFVLHAVQLAMWVAIPALLVAAGLEPARHWQIYLPAVLASFVVMGLTLFRLEKLGYLRAVFLVAIGLILLVQIGLAMVAGSGAAPTLGALGVLLFMFFCGFNVLEASQPSLASRVAPPHARGTALGVYNTLQSLGFFAGGVAGGWTAKVFGPLGLFYGCGALICLWLIVAWRMLAPAHVAAGAALPPLGG